jgi:Ca2+-transporting ATPase
MDFHSSQVEEVLGTLGSTKNGISREEAKNRLTKYGPNMISGAHRRTFFDIIIDQFKNFILLLLVAAVIVAALIGHTEDAIGISLAIALSVVFGVVLEYKADESMRALQKLQSPRAVAIRSGKNTVVDATELVPGDVIYLEEGEKVPADCRIIQTNNLQVNESALTGESVPVVKNQHPVTADASLSERFSMIYAGTFVVGGHSTALVVETGDRTELGKIAAKLSEIESEETVLQKSLDDLGKKVSVASVVVIMIFFAIGMLQGRDITELFILGISLVVAAVPEGLLTALTVILALGVKRMAKHNALVRKLNVVETLGSATVIVVDKTGTITQGKMMLTKFCYGGKLCSSSSLEGDGKIIAYASYCNSAKVTDKGFVGDEMDKAILHTAELRGMPPGKLRKLEPLAFHPLDSVRKRMSVLVELDGEKMAIVKGAPEIIMDLCENLEEDGEVRPLDKDGRKDIETALDSMTQNGMRVLAVAYRKTASKKEADMESGLTFLGLLGFSDPARTEAYETIRVAKQAGIRIIMLTGDNLRTATAIGREVGLVEDGKDALEWSHFEKLDEKQLEKKLENVALIARSTPLSKLKVVEMLIQKGEVVVVTGDGVNDALALKKAQVGVVMGSGTDVSKEAGNLVLLDDNIATLIGAIKYGRTVFSNIINFIRFQFTTNLAILTLFFISFFTDLPYFLSPIEILFINIVMDGPPAIALGFEKSVKGVLEEKPRRGKNILTKGTVESMILSALFMVIITTGVYAYFKDHSPDIAASAVFVTFVLLQLFNALNCRFRKDHFYANPGSNRYLFVALGGLIVVLIAIVSMPELQLLFSVTALPISAWVIVLLAGASILVFEEIKKMFLPNFTE